MPQPSHGKAESHEITMNTFTKLAAVLLTMSASTLWAQRFAPTVALKLGVVRNLQEPSFEKLPRYSFLPELQVEHRLFGHMHDSLVFSAAIYGNFWDDGVEKVWEHCRDCDTYSKSEQTIGMRFGMLMTKFPLLPLGFYLGYAQRHIAFEYLGGNGFGGGSFDSWLHTFETGVFIKPRLWQRWYLLGEAQRLFPLHDRRHFITPERRRAFKLGLAFAFGK